MKIIKINKTLIGEGKKPYIIAEACINHQGNMKIAKKMIEKASQCGVSAVKFQFHVLEDEMLKTTLKSKNFTKNLYDTLDETNFNIKEHKELKRFCKIKNLDYLCTPFSFKSADILEKDIKVKVFKMGSGELTNHPLQVHVAKKKLPTIISTGMSELNEISETLKIIKKFNKKICLTQCTSAYPCPPNISNIGVIPVFKKKFNIPIGLSDHTNNNYTSFGSIALGACLIEKHFTLDKSWSGPDHASSINPEELKQLVNGCMQIYLAKSDIKKIHPQEKQIISWARESLVTIKDIKKDENFTINNISVKRPAPNIKEIPPKFFWKILKKKSRKNLKKNEKLKWTDIK
jgi:sialic acid synthase SpsE